MARMKLRKKRKFDRITRLFIVIILVIMSTFLLLGFISKRAVPILFNYAEMEAKRLSNLIINKAITKEITTGIETDKLFNLIKNEDGEIQTIDFNSIVVNKVLSTTTNVIQKNIKALGSGDINYVDIPEEYFLQYDKRNLKKGIIYEIPMGAVTGNMFLSNLGPKIPVKLSLIGSVLSNINTKINQYGINNALVEICVHIELTEQVNLPMMFKRVTVKTDVPIAIKIIEGKIPLYYSSSGLEKNSPILAIPSQPSD